MQSTATAGLFPQQFSASRSTISSGTLHDADGVVYESCLFGAVQLADYPVLNELLKRLANSAATSSALESSDAFARHWQVYKRKTGSGNLPIIRNNNFYSPSFCISFTFVLSELFHFWRDGHDQLADWYALPGIWVCVSLVRLAVSLTSQDVSPLWQRRIHWFPSAKP